MSVKKVFVTDSFGFCDYFNSTEEVSRFLGISVEKVENIIIKGIEFEGYTIDLTIC